MCHRTTLECALLEIWLHRLCNNGQTEQTNQELKTYLCIFCTNNPTKWVQFLPSAEFHHNSAPHSSTKVSPFSLLYGYEPHSYPALGKTFLPALEEWLFQLNKAWKEALAAHDSAQNSWPPKQPSASILGKSEIRSGLRPLILDCATLLGNSLPRDMVPSKLFRYYLLSLINSNFLPHGKYTMYVFHASPLSSYRSTEPYGPTFSSPPPDVVMHSISKTSWDSSEARQAILMKRPMSF